MANVTEFLLLFSVFWLGYGIASAAVLVEDYFRFKREGKL